MCSLQSVRVVLPRFYYIRALLVLRALSWRERGAGPSHDPAPPCGVAGRRWVSVAASHPSTAVTLSTGAPGLASTADLVVVELGQSVLALEAVLALVAVEVAVPSLGPIALSSPTLG